MSWVIDIMAQDTVTEQDARDARNCVCRGTDVLYETVQDQAERTQASELTFPKVAALVFAELPSESSRRVYRHTFQQWEQYALKNELNVMELFFDKVESFLYSRNLSHNTRLSRKSHMQRLLRAAAYLDPSFGIHYIQLRDLTLESTSRDKAPRREPRVLSNEECQQLLAIWKNDESHKGIRNGAVLFLLAHTAIRNAELVALRWEDLDWDAQTLTVCRGSEGQRCIVPIRGASSETLDSLRRLQIAQQTVRPCRDMPYKHIFPALSTGKNVRFQPEKDIRTSTQTIRNIVKQAAEIAGLGQLSSLDLRHTSLRMFFNADVAHADVSYSKDG